MTAIRKFSRRSFLKTSGTLAATAPFILPSHIWAAETKPNDRLTLGFVGLGTQGRGLMSGFLDRKDTQTLAVCDVDTTRRDHARKMVDDKYAKQTATDYKGCTAYKDFRELIARKDVDAVVIATPDHWHALIATAVARAGKDIYCEKPLSESVREARAMVDAVRKNNRVFQTGSMQRSSREFRVACELVQNGIIGKISRVEVAVGDPGIPCNLPEEEVEPGLDWDMWLGPAPKRGYHSELSPRGVHKHFPNWRNYREYGGGMITDWGAHHFDIAQWGMGMDDSGPVEIFPAEQPGAKRGVRYKYANGVEVIHKDGPGVTFFGSEGKVIVNRGKFELWMGDQQKAGAIPKPPPDNPEQKADRGKLLAQDLEAVEKEYLAGAKIKLYKSSDHKSDWLNAIKNRAKPICDVEVGARSVTVCHLINLAYYHGQKMQWDPKKNDFVGHTGSREWLDVPHRDPWKLT
jgi:predicted dehydrogenase